MNCPVCGSELPSGVKYCPVCGTDVEGALMRSQQQAAARNVPPTQQMPAQQAPAYGQAPQQAPHYQQQYSQRQYVQQPYGQQQGRAVPMNSSMPRQGQPMGRELDTSQMDSSPKWPIVLIAILAILIVVVVLLIFRPWDALQANNPATGDQQGNVSTQTGDQQTGQDQQVVTPPLSDPSQGSDATTVTDPSVPAVDPAVAANEALFQNLSAYYGELAGLDAQISATATDFNNNYTSSDLATRQAYASAAATLYATINTNLDALNAMVVAPSSPYYTTWQNMVTLYSCLSNRIRVISEAWNLAVVDPYDGQISAILSADNVGGVNKYKTQYQELYPVSQPVQQ